MTQKPQERNEVQELEYYTPAQLSLKIGVAQKTIENWSSEWRVPGQIKMGGTWRYRIREVERALFRDQFLEPSRKEERKRNDSNS